MKTFRSPEHYRRSTQSDELRGLIFWLLLPFPGSANSSESAIFLALVPKYGHEYG